MSNLYDYSCGGREALFVGSSMRCCNNSGKDAWPIFVYNNCNFRCYFRNTSHITTLDLLRRWCNFVIVINFLSSFIILIFIPGFSSLTFWPYIVRVTYSWDFGVSSDIFLGRRQPAKLKIWLFFTINFDQIFDIDSRIIFLAKLFLIFISFTNYVSSPWLVLLGTVMLMLVAASKAQKVKQQTMISSMWSIWSKKSDTR